MKKVLLPVLVAGLAASLLAGNGGVVAAQTQAPRTETIVVGLQTPRGDVSALDARIARLVASGELVRTYAAPDPLGGGRRHEYFAQRHQGVPVLGGGISRQQVDGTTVSAFGRLYTGIDVTVGARLPEERALARVSAAVGSAQAPGGGTSLVILPTLDGSYRLTYRAWFRDGQIRFIDAVTGEVVRTEDAFRRQRAIGTGRGSHGDLRKVSATRNGGQYEAVDLFRPARINTRSTLGRALEWPELFEIWHDLATDVDNDWTSPAIVDAHTNAGMAYDYFHQQQGWQGVDGANTTVEVLVADRATLENNAFFAFPGEGSNVGMLGFGISSAGITMAALDVVGHEMMHGVTFFSMRQRTGDGLGAGIFPDGLGPEEAVWQGQRLECNNTVLQFSDGTIAPFLCSNGQFVLASNHAGAIDEGVSDVFGAAVEFHFQAGGAGPLRADYDMAEDVVPAGSSLPPGVRRSLSAPADIALESTGLARYPEHFDRRIRHTVVVVGNQAAVVPFAIIDGQLVSLGVDNGAVHMNASLMGHVFYRAVEGGTHRHSGAAVAGVGASNRGMIEKVFFRAMTVLMPSDPTFPTAAAVLRQAAADLYGSDSPAYRAIDQSLHAAGL